MHEVKPMYWTKIENSLLVKLNQVFEEMLKEINQVNKEVIKSLAANQGNFWNNSHPTISGDF